MYSFVDAPFTVMNAVSLPYAVFIPNCTAHTGKQSYDAARKISFCRKVQYYCGLFAKVQGSLLIFDYEGLHHNTSAMIFIFIGRISFYQIIFI